MNSQTRQYVRRRASQRCEYCQLHQKASPLVPLQIEHIIPRKHGGTDEPANLALACIDCNLAKASNIAGLDPLTGELTRLFDPRKQTWSDHFMRQGAWIVGLTAVGRTTAHVLNINSTDQIQLRLLL